MLVVSAIRGVAAESPTERRYIQMYAGFVRRVPRDANIYTRVNLQSNGVNYASSQWPPELNTAGGMAESPAAGMPPHLANNDPRWLFEN